MEIASPRYWLHEQIEVEKTGWDPVRAMQSAINWIQASAYEVEQEHGHSPADQLHSCLQHFDSRITTRNAAPPLAPIFASLFHSLTFSLSLASLLEHGATAPWTFPSAVVMYYYATYNAARSILAAQEDFHGETHTSAIHAYNGLAAKLPHPFNMIATHVKGEEYQAILPSYPDAVKVDLTQKFSNDRVVAQGMLRAYLSGTADWNVGKIKERLKREGKVQDFRTKASQALRDSKLPLKFNYLNCIFRYRGKANYRDTIFLPYGKKHSWLNPGYLHGLYVMSSFAFICGVAFAEKRIGKKRVVAFIEDIAGNLRGRDSAMGLELFWEDLVSNYIRSS